MLMKEKIDSIYKESSVFIRTKAPNLLILMLIVLVLEGLNIINGIIGKEYVAVVLHFVIFFAACISLFCLFRGNYKLASILPLVATVFALTALSFMITPETPYQAFMIFAFMISPLFFSIAISEKPAYTLLTAVFCGIVMVAAIILVLIIKLGASNVSAIHVYVSALLLYILGASFCYRTAHVNYFAMLLTENSNKKSNEKIDKVNALLDESKDASKSLRLLEGDFSKADTGIRSIFEQIMKLNKGSGELRSNVETISKSLRSTAEMAEGFNSRVEEQNTVVLESTASVNQMSASLDSVADITQEKQKAADNLINTANDGVEALHLTNDSLQKVNEQMNELLKINRIVGAVAAQTNLLGMNAAIEAAHAGEYGSGFAVVADEIRKLANTTSNNSRNISDGVKQLLSSLTNMTSHAQKTDIAMKEIVKEIKAVSLAFNEITHSAQELSNGGKEILNAMQVLQKSSVDIRDGSEKITREQTEATNVMEEVGAVADNFSASTQQVETALNGINDILVRLNSVMKNTIEKSSSLDSAIYQLTTHT